jgi:hypothetical protein
MKLLARVFLAPFLVIVVVLAVFDRVSGGNRRRRVAPFADRLAAIGDGMTIGALGAAVASLAVILLSDTWGVPARVLPLVAALPLVGGYIGAAVGFRLAGGVPAGSAPGETDDS